MAGVMEGWGGNRMDFYHTAWVDEDAEAVQWRSGDVYLH